MSSDRQQQARRRQAVMRWLMLLAPVAVGGVFIKLGAPLFPTLCFVVLATIFRDHWVTTNRPSQR